ncbi:MAG TPA: penicillin-binding protein activator [Rhizomicrobium sp.]|jgi:ABC-type branched-subunit amino acid transport system substrate-binding protein|nr:penicillin-binding protein activator [Rhizomicrobium sp.]
MRFPVPSFRRLCAIAGLVAIAGLAGCATTKKGPDIAPTPKPTETAETVVPTTTPTHPLDSDSPSFLRLGNMSSARTPVRIGVLLPFGSSTAGTKALANTMLKAAELAMFDSGSRDILLMTADEGSSGDSARAGARKLLDQGAEIIIGPIYASSVRAITSMTRDRAVPVIAFSTDRSVAGDGVYLLSFQPEDLVQRVMHYAADHGHKNFAAMVPSTAYGQVVEKEFRQSATESGAKISDVQHFTPDVTAVQTPSAAVAHSDADAILIGQGGSVLKAIGVALRSNGVDPVKAKLLGTGLWDDPTIGKEPTLDGAWFAAPSPYADDAFNAKYRAAFGGSPPQLAGLAYDAVSLIAILAQGKPYHRFTPETLTDPNGFSGVNGIFRFHQNGTIERGLAILSIGPNGFSVVDPAPRTFQHSGS